MSEERSISKIIRKYKYLLLPESLKKSKDIDLKEIGCLADNFEEFLFSQSDAVCSRGDVLLKLTELINSFGLVQSFDGVEDREFSENDFPYQAERAEDCFRHLSSLLLHYDTIETSCKRKFLVQVLMLCGTHHDKYMWSDKKSVALCSDFITDLLKSTKQETLGGLLTNDTFHPTIFKALLRSMRPSLMKDSWMKNPSSCYIFYWLLSHVKHPHLIDYLQDILPPSFMFISYHSVPQVVLGVKCFDHILDNVPPTSIKCDGYEEVIFDTLKRISQFNKEKDILELIYPCILKLPMVNSEKADQTQWRPYDVILQQLLDNAAMECNLELRYIYLSSIHLFISTVPCFKLLSKALSVIYNNLTSDSTTEEECKIISLKILREIIRTCWPRIENHFFNIMLSLLKVMYDIGNMDENKRESQVLSLCEECICMLKHVCPETFKVRVSEYLEGEEASLPGALYLKTLIEV